MKELYGFTVEHAGLVYFYPDDKSDTLGPYSSIFDMYSDLIHNYKKYVGTRAYPFVVRENESKFVLVTGPRPDIDQKVFGTRARAYGQLALIVGDQIKGEGYAS